MIGQCHNMHGIYQDRSVKGHHTSILCKLSVMINSMVIWAESIKRTYLKIFQYNTLYPTHKYQGRVGEGTTI